MTSVPSISLPSFLPADLGFNLQSTHRYMRMDFWCRLVGLFAAVALVTSGPVGKELHAALLSNRENPKQYCGDLVDNGGCPAQYPCELEFNPWANKKQFRCPCYSFCSVGNQICQNDLTQYLANKYCVSNGEDRPDLGNALRRGLISIVHWQ